MLRKKASRYCDHTHIVEEICDAVYRFNRSIVLGQSKKVYPIWSGPCIVTQVSSSVLYCIDNRKLFMVAHHDSLKLCSDRYLPIWLLRKHHELRGTLW